MKMKQLLVLSAIALQVIGVAAIAISKEWVLATGRDVILQTAPIDPRDIFRGDYVRLDYLFSNLQLHQLDADIIETGLNKGQKVYLSLTTDIIGIAQGGRLYTSPPADGLYLSGRVRTHWPYRGYSSDSASNKNRRSITHPVPVKYGIEQYYVEQGKGLAMEKTRGSRNSFQVPMLIHAGLSDSGNAVIRSFEWSNLAMKTEVAQSPERDAPDDRSSAVMRFTVMNRSEQDLNLAWKPNGCSFTLIPNASAPAESVNLRFDRAECDGVVTEVKTLAPEETLSVDFDLNMPQWHVLHSGKNIPMGKLPWNYRFRIRYVEENMLAVNAMILSRAFHGRGNID